MKRARLAVLFLIVAALLAGTPALASTHNVKLTPTGVEPGASGQARLAETTGFYPNFYGHLSVSCKGLTPGATYYFWASAPHLYGGWTYTWPFTASPTGTGKADGWIDFSWLGFPVGVMNAKGQDVLTGEVE
jgi:hypothetical protein